MASDSNRRLRQLTLLSVLALMLAICVVLAAFSFRRSSARLQRAAVESVVKLGGFVHYDFGAPYDKAFDEYRNAGGTPPDKPWPTWLRDLLGEDFFFGVRSVSFRKVLELKDEDLVPLSNCRHLRSLNLEYCPITDEGLKHIAPLKLLTSLDLGNTHISSRATRYLSNLRQLRVLSLAHTPANDDSLTHLKNNNELIFVNLNGCRGVTDSGLTQLLNRDNIRTLKLNDTTVTAKSLRRQTNLVNLHLSGTEVGDAELKLIARLKHLELLTLNRSHITVDGLDELVGMTSLRHLVLGGPRITDEAVEALLRIKSLESLVLQKTQMSDSGIRRLEDSIKYVERRDYEMDGSEL